MSGIIRVIVLLAVAVCITEAQLYHTESCLCKSVSPRLQGSRGDISDIQIYRETTFCTQVEIQVTMKNGHRYCLEPNKLVTRILRGFMKR